MDSSEREPSYYEVALTHRQVLAGFVILLACLFAAFFSGIWVGQSGAPRGGPAVASAEPPAGAQDARLDQLTFFGDRSKNGPNGPIGSQPVAGPAPAKPAAAPPAVAAPAEPTPAETEAEKLRATLEAEMNAHREGAAPNGTTAGAAAPAAGARVQRAVAAEPGATATAPAVAPVAKPAAANGTKPASATSAFWVQVYSTPTRAKADDIVARLKKGGYPTRLLSPTPTSKNFRVRVGPYPARDKATSVADKLRKDFKLETWVTDRL